MKKIILIILGFICLIIGGVGIIIPILPTTPLVVLASLCFASSSEKLYSKLLNAKFFGEFIRNYREKTGIRKSTKLYSILFVNIMILISIFFIDLLWVKIMLGVIALAVTIHILLLKRRNK